MNIHQIFLFASVLASGAVTAQNSHPYTASRETLDRIAATDPPGEATAPLLYLASDSLRGRFIGTPGIDSAANYIAREFRLAGAQPIPGNTGYFQVFTHHFNAGGLDSGSVARDVSLRNVMAVIPGTDPQLRDQYIVLSSHYDHLGVTRHPKIEEGKLDSIYNGARDNASGTTAVIDAARYFVNNDPTGGQLFFESDNAPLAMHGVPAPTYSFGMRAMDSTIFNRYHQLSDETGNMDLSYVLKWIHAYILAARFIADEPDQPTWTAGDTNEKNWHALYNK